MTRDYVYWLVLALLLVGYGVWQALRPVPLDWSPTLQLGGDNPYDLRALDAVWSDLAPTRPLATQTGSLLDLLTDSTADPTRTVALIDAIIDLELTDPQSPLDSTTRQAIVDFASRGGTLLLAGVEVDRSVLRALGLARQQVGTSDFGLFVSPLRDTSRYHVEVESTGAGAFVPTALVQMGMGRLPVSVGDGPDSLLLPGASRPDALAVVCADDCAIGYNEKMLPARVGGRGSVVVTSGALALTNIALLDYDTLPLADALIAALPDGPIVRRLDTFASGRPASPLYVLTRFPALRWAWYTLLALGLLTLVAHVRRRQRPQEPAMERRNETAAFVQTVAALYRRRGDHANLTRKMASRFRHIAYDAYGLTRKQQTAEHIAARTGLPLADAEHLVAWVDGAETGTADDRIRSRGVRPALGSFRRPRAPHIRPHRLLLISCSNRPILPRPSSLTRLRKRTRRASISPRSPTLPGGSAPKSAARSWARKSA